VSPESSLQSHIARARASEIVEALLPPLVSVLGGSIGQCDRLSVEPQRVVTRLF